MVGIVSSSIGHIVEDFLSNKPVSLGNCQESNWSEGSLGIDVETLALASTHIKGQLASYCKSMANLTLSRSEFSKNLRD
jgi:hypothetical protein